MTNINEELLNAAHRLGVADAKREDEPRESGHILTALTNRFGTAVMTSPDRTVSRGALAEAYMEGYESVYG